MLQPAGLLREGNALMNVGFALASVGGAALAGLLIAELGIAAALYVDAASFLIIAVAARGHARPTQGDGGERELFGERFRAGLRYARENRAVRLLLVGQAVALILFTLIIPIEVIYAKESLGTTSAGYGVLLAAWGAGIVIGSLRLPPDQAPVGLRPRRDLHARDRRSATSGSRPPTRCSWPASSRSSAAPGNGVQWIAVMTALQERTPTAYQARITGSDGVDRGGDAGRRLPAGWRDRGARSIPAWRMRSRAAARCC